jgi:hypothetical protein
MGLSWNLIACVIHWVMLEPCYIQAQKHWIHIAKVCASPNLGTDRSTWWTCIWKASNHWPSGARVSHPFWTIIPNIRESFQHNFPDSKKKWYLHLPMYVKLLPFPNYCWQCWPRVQAIFCIFLCLPVLKRRNNPTGEIRREGLSIRAILHVDYPGNCIFG